MAEQFPPGDYQEALPEPQFPHIDQERLKLLAAKRAAAEAAIAQQEAARMVNMREQDRFRSAMAGGGSPEKMRAILSGYDRMERQLPEQHKAQLEEEALRQAVLEAQKRETQTPLGSLKAAYK